MIGENKFIPIKKKREVQQCDSCNVFPSLPPFWETKSKHGVLTAQKLLTIQISEKIYPRQKSKNITGLLSWSFRCLTPPSQAPLPAMAGFLHRPASLVPNATQELFQKKKKKKWREFAYHNTWGKKLLLSFPQLKSCNKYLSWPASPQREFVLVRGHAVFFEKHSLEIQQLRMHDLNDFDTKTFQRAKSRWTSEILD